MSLTGKILPYQIVETGIISYDEETGKTRVIGPDNIPVAVFKDDVRELFDNQQEISIQPAITEVLTRDNKLGLKRAYIFAYLDTETSVKLMKSQDACIDEAYVAAMAERLGDVSIFCDEFLPIVNGNKYAQYLIDKGYEINLAVKGAPVIARQITEPEGETVVTIVKGGEETTNHGDPGDWVVINADAETKTPIAVDTKGTLNRYIIKAEDFPKLYDVSSIGDDGFAKPLGTPRKVIRISESIAIEPSWGGEQLIRAGGVLNITNPDDVYGVAKDEFEQTHTIIGKV